ncbi:MAG TPA: hypothetical protein VM841_09920 [Actinomycetota bacterium]|nr:hypothetical protein [Actinomycetota bacterium]
MSRKTTRRTARRLLGVAVLAGLSILTSTTARAANASATSLAASKVKGDSAQFPVFGVTLTQPAEVDSLTDVVVRFQSMVNFSTGDLAPDFSAFGCTNGDATSCDGVPCASSRWERAVRPHVARASPPTGTRWASEASSRKQAAAPRQGLGAAARVPAPGRDGPVRA